MFADNLLLKVIHNPPDFDALQCNVNSYTSSVHTKHNLKFNVQKCKNLSSSQESDDIPSKVNEVIGKSMLNDIYGAPSKESQTS